MNQFDIKELFIKNIKDNTTLNIALALVEEWSNYKSVLDKIKDTYTSMQFSAPENMYVFIEQLEQELEDLLEELNE